MKGAREGKRERESEGSRARERERERERVRIFNHLSDIFSCDNRWSSSRLTCFISKHKCFSITIVRKIKNI